ncbi:MAG: TetR/AcrR family transcriptional regulator [Pseudomonadota bacterium]
MAQPQGSSAERILKAGRALFFEHGFQNVSTDMIAREASVSKSSLYKHFPNKAALLKAVTEAEAAHFEARRTPQIESFDALQSELSGYGERLMSFLNRPDVIRFTQLMNEEARENPEIARVFYRAAYARTLDHMSALLRQGVERGYISAGRYPDEMARQLLGMWEGVPMVEMMMGAVARPFAKPRAWARDCVAVFMRGVAA